MWGVFGLNWFGRILGGTTGYLIGGPLGGYLGFIIGNQIQEQFSSGATAVVCRNCKNNGIIYEEGWHTCPQCNSPSYYFCFKSRADYFQFAHTMFLYLLYYFCKSGGAITREKISVVMDFLYYDFGYDVKQRQSALGIFNNAKYSNMNPTEVVQKYYYCFQDDPDALKGTINLLLRISKSGGKYHQKESEFLLEIYKIFQIGSDKKEELSFFQLRKLEDCYAILGCKMNDSLDIVKSKYRVLVKQKHPDIFFHQSLSEEELLKINKKFIEIQIAYEKIIQSNQNDVG